MEAWRERMRAHADAACVHVLVNEGRDGGASLPHTHAQLYALDFVPAAVARERERFGAYATRTMGGNLLADLVQEEVRRRERVVAVDDEAVLIAPYASRLPFQLMIAPRRPRARFEDDGPLAAGLRARRARRLRRRLGGVPPLNLLGPHRAARRRPLLLADRHPPAADAPRRAGARHRRAPLRRRARAGGGGAARELTVPR